MRQPPGTSDESADSVCQNQEVQNTMIDLKSTIGTQIQNKSGHEFHVFQLDKRENGTSEADPTCVNFRSQSLLSTKDWPQTTAKGEWFVRNVELALRVHCVKQMVPPHKGQVTLVLSSMPYKYSTN